MQPIKHSDWGWFVSIPLPSEDTAEQYAAEMRAEYEEVEVDPRENGDFVVKYRGRRRGYETSKQAAETGGEGASRGSGDSRTAQGAEALL